MERGQARQRLPAGLGHGPREGARGGNGGPAENWASMPKWREVKAGKRICFPFSELIFFQITFPIDFQILSAI
jgi:hypothetical protein